MSNIKKFPNKEATDAVVKKALDSSSRKEELHESQVKEFYNVYVSNGWHPVTLHPGRKRPVGDKWQNRYADIEAFTGFHNIGIMLGDPSGDLTDSDIDCEELIPHADYFLPKTGAKFGRYYGTGSQKLGHRLYISPIKEPLKIKKPMGGMAVEIRPKDGLQTMVPPSFVFDPDLQDLDLVCWEGGSKAKPPKLADVSFVTAEEIIWRHKILATSVFSAKYFTAGSFHLDTLAWCGFLAKSGCPKELVLLSVKWLVENTGQDNLVDRLACVEDTFHKYDNGETLAGITTLKESGWDEKHIAWLKLVINPKKQLDSDGRPHIKVVDSKETELMDETISAMISTKKFYHQHGQTCIIHRDKYRGVLVTPLTDAIAMGSWLTREIMFTKSNLDKTTGQYVDQMIKAPTSLSAELSNLHTFRGDMPHLQGVSAIPTITPKGRIVEESWSYDPDLELFFACTYAVRKYHPDEAIRVLSEPFLDFPFVGGVGSKDNSLPSGIRLARYSAASIAALISAVVRPVLDICPMFVGTSAQWQDGKTILCNIIAAAVGMKEGSANSPLTRGGSDEEQEKQLSSALSRGKRVMIFDNHDGEFRSPALTEVLTSSNPEFRILGKNEVRSIPNKSVCMMNGVNVVLAGDLQTRTVFIRMSRDSIDPNRNFRHEDVVGWVEQNQTNLVSAAISAVEWALSQDDGDWKPTHRFKIWDRMVRRTIMLLCGVDISPPAIYDNDRTLDPVEEVKTNLQRWFVEIWEAGVRSPKSKQSPFVMPSDLVTRIAPESEEEGWVNVLSRRKNQPLSYQLGACLRTLENVPFSLPEKGGQMYKIEKSMHNGATVYRLKTINGGIG